jgi:hypothetical protein
MLTYATSVRGECDHWGHTQQKSHNLVDNITMI